MEKGIEKGKTTKKPKILFVIADVAAGHKSGAEAVHQAIEAIAPGQYNVKTIDLFKLADVQPFNSLDTFHTLVSQNRWFEKFLDFWMWLTTSILPFYEIFYYYMQWKMLEDARSIIAAEKPDLVVSVHPFASMLLRGIKSKYPETSYKTATVITDLATFYRGWGDLKAEQVFVPTNEGIERVISFGVAPDKISGPVFPIKPGISNFREKDTVMAELGFSPKRKTVLITGGGLGLKSMLKVINDLVMDTDLQLIIIAGKLSFFRQQLEMRYKNIERVKVFGFVSNIQDYFNVADVIITKPGPATILEAELFNKQVILTRKIGWQETGNITYALQNPNFHYIGERWQQLKTMIDKLWDSSAAKNVKIERRRFDEAQIIAKKLLSLINK